MYSHAGSINRIIKPAGAGMYIYADVSPIWLNLVPYDKGVGYKEMSSISADQYRSCIWALMRGDGGCGVSANEYSCSHEAQINFGNLTQYLAYANDRLWKCMFSLTGVFVWPKFMRARQSQFLSLHCSYRGQTLAY